jgi:hypothetical protein
MEQFTIIHWLYLLGVLTVVATMILKRNVVIPCILFTFVIALVFTGSFIGAVTTIFTAWVVAANELLGIFLMVGVMVALLECLKVTGASQVMVVPLRPLMKSPLITYILIVVVTTVFSLLFWPTPAIPIIAAMLLVPALKAGLPPMMCAIAVALAGQGMALASDLVIQGGPGLTAAAAGVPTEMIVWRGTLLTIITGLVAIPLAWFMNRREISDFARQREKGQLAELEFEAQSGGSAKTLEGARYGKLATGLLVAMIGGIIIALVALGIRGGDATALLAGATLVLISVLCVLVYKSKGLDSVADRVGEGLAFAFKVMGPIIPIAGFFFIGSPAAAPLILGEGAPGYLFDWGEALGRVIGPGGIVASLGILTLGLITGLDGSGFSGLPLVGTLSAGLAGGNQEIAATLASVGQMGAVWSGGGTLVAWSTLVAVAGIFGVSVLDLAKKNFIPVIAGLLVSTMVAIIFLL